MTLDSNGLQIPAHELERLVCCDFSGDDRVWFWSELARVLEKTSWHNPEDAHKFMKELKKAVREYQAKAATTY